MHTLAHQSLPPANGIFNVPVETGRQINRFATRLAQTCTRLRQCGVAAMVQWASLTPRRHGDEAAAARESSPEGFEETMLCHLDAAYNLARFLTRDANAAEDLVQEAVLKAYRGFSVFRGGDAKAWLLTIVRREVIDWANARRRSHQVFSDVEGDFIEEVPFDANDPEQELIKKDEHAAVRRAIHSLPATYRESIILRDIEELSYREIAVVTEVSIGTVMSRLSRGRFLLTQKLLSISKEPSRPRSGQ